jgi:hypothetical protein
MSTNTGFTMPTETVELPSKGLLYPSGSELSLGTVEMKYMTAKEEDILTNINYIRNNTVFDKLIQSLLVTKVNYDDLLVCDRDALLIAARILGYGQDYKYAVTNPNTGTSEVTTVDLSQLKTLEFDSELLKVPNTNEIEYTLPSTGTKLTFKLLTVKDEKDIEKDLQAFKKINPLASPELSTRLKTIITSVNGDSSKSVIRDFVDNHFLARDSRDFRKYLKSITPGIELKFDFVSENYTQEGIELELDSTFFWPES